MIQTEEDFINKIFTSHFIERVRKGLLKVCVWEGAGDRTELKYFEPHSYGSQRFVFLVLQMLNRRPWGPLCWAMAFFTAYYQQLLWSPNSIGVPEGPLGRVWLSLPHSSITPSPNVTATVTWLLSWLSYIIVQRPLDRPLDLWNGMIDRHPAEITVMQFTGHSLPVHQSMSVSWALPVPFHQPNPPTRSLSIIGHWNVSLPSGASLCNGMFARAEGQNTTVFRIL